MSEQAEIALRALASNNDTTVAEFFDTIPAVLGQRYAPACKTLTNILEDDLLCPVLGRLKNTKLVTHADMVDALNSAGFEPQKARGWLLSIEDWLQHRFPRLANIPPSATIEEEGSAQKLKTENPFYSRMPKFVLFEDDAAPTQTCLQARRADGTAIVAELKTYMPALLSRLKCKAPKLRCIESTDISKACLYVFKFFLCKHNTVYPSSMFANGFQHVGEMMHQFMPHLPLRGKKKVEALRLRDKNMDEYNQMACTWEEKLTNFFHNNVKTNSLKRLTTIPVSRADCVDLQHIEILISKGLNVELNDDLPALVQKEDMHEVMPGESEQQAPSASDYDEDIELREGMVLPALLVPRGPTRIPGSNGIGQVVVPKPTEEEGANTEAEELPIPKRKRGKSTAGASTPKKSRGRKKAPEARPSPAVASEYERQRARNMASNASFLENLGLGATQQKNEAPTRRKVHPKVSA